MYLIRQQLIAELNTHVKRLTVDLTTEHTIFVVEGQRIVVMVNTMIETIKEIMANYESLHYQLDQITETGSVTPLRSEEFASPFVPVSSGSSLCFSNGLSQLSFSDITLTTNNHFKIIFDKIMTDNNYSFNNMCNMVSVEIHGLEMGKISKKTIKNFYYNNGDFRGSTLNKIGAWIDKELDLDNEDIKIIEKKKVSGDDFLDFNVEKLIKYGLEDGLAERIVKLVNTIKSEEQVEVLKQEVLELKKELEFLREDVDPEDLILCGSNDNAKNNEEQSLNDKSYEQYLKSYVATNSLSLKINVYTVQKPYSEWTFNAVSNIFELPTHYMDIPKFTCGTNKLEDEKSQKLLLHLIEDLKIHRSTIHGVSEAYNSKFVLPFLAIASSVCGAKVKIYPEEYIQGKYGRGPVDFCMILEKIIISVLEVKRDDFIQGTAQIIVLLHSSLESSRKKRHEDDDFVINKAYGIVTDKEETSINWGSNFEKRVTKVLGQIVWLFKDAEKLIESAKQKKLYKLSMQPQRDESMYLSEIDSLKLELEQIVKEKNALKVENANLRQIIEENSRRDVEFKSRIKKLEKSRADTAFENAKLKTEVVKLRSDFEEIKSKRITTDSLEQLPISSSAKNEMETNLTNPQCTISSICAKSKSSEDKKIEFLEQVHKEQIRNEIKKRNREKKLRSQDPLSSDKVIEGNSDIKYPASQTIIQIKMLCNQKIEQDIIQEVILFIKKSLTLSSDKKTYSQNEPNISETHDSNIEINNDERELAQLFSDAEFAEGKMIKAKQKEVICWYTYRKAYQTSIADICFKTGVSDKTAKNQVYAIIRASLLNVSETNLYKKTQRAENVYKLFGKITDPITKEEIKEMGIDKVYGTSYGVRSISELTDAQILNIIKQVTEKTHDILAIGQELHAEILPKANSSISVNSKKLPGITLEKSLKTKSIYGRDWTGFLDKVMMPNKNYLYQYAIKHGINFKEFSIITEAEKHRWTMGCFRGDLERDIHFYHGGIEIKEDPRKYHKFLTDRERLVDKKLLCHSILKSGLSTA
ncbi:4228_t:CDS:10 [Cetraspora pellucida]|uniref:4228_t:CDS:1 n=1 Tax=Cetraspora pellucida TaxID=1433469 RepID=A0A9N9F3B9_9GLOM|nr:4228_t:CDS:10 [Cetraspora pellucida]